MNLVRPEVRADQAVANYSVDGAGVIVAVLDRGIDWTHPDFRNADGSTRILAMLDMSGQNYCSAGNPTPVEYSQAQINAALNGGPSIGMRDAVGHGTLTAGTAAGNGRGMSGDLYAGIAPKADLLIVKMTSEGAPAHGTQTAEAPFVACADDALTWTKAKLDAYAKPAVIILNSGTQFGPMDGTSAVSRKIASTFGSNVRGRVVVLPAGDEGSLANHGGVDFTSSAAGSISIDRTTTTTAVMSAWYSGATPANVTVSFADGTSVGPVAPNSSGASADNSVLVYQYAPGAEFYPWTSTSGDRAVWISVSGHATTGTFKIQATGSGTGHVDLYTDVVGPNLTPVTAITNHLTPGRIQDFATTPTVIVAGDYNMRTMWTDIDNTAQSITDEGAVGDLWLKSSPGPTRDHRSPAIDIAAPGQNLFAAISTTSYWATLRYNSPQGSPSSPIEYSRFGGTSGAAPIVVGAVALMLQINPQLNAAEVRHILHSTARTDGVTGAAPNTEWGYGKLDVNAAVGRAKDTVFDDAFEF